MKVAHRKHESEISLVKFPARSFFYYEVGNNTLGKTDYDYNGLQDACGGENYRNVDAAEFGI